jgi:anti-anti-sigma regulatory factor
MELTVTQAQGRVPVTIIGVAGHLDGQSYQSLIQKAREVFEAGSKHLLLDLADLTYISSAGLVSLNTITLMIRGEALPDPEQGWSTLKSMDRPHSVGGTKINLKLLNPRPEITNVFEMVGFSEFFDVFTDKQTAINSF